ncbi:lysyl-tRNA synthetase [mine drainage metagenome]|uniref:Lysyl-tRNA synthetase n=1 Tax=mine drainage metagenome TaxID=410659 RepID=T1CQK5_9ZZZZ
MKKGLMELSEPGSDNVNNPLDYRHVATLVQIYDDPSRLRNILEPNGDMIKVEDVEKIMSLAKHWISTYAPDTFKFSLLPIGSIVTLTDLEKNIISDFEKWAEKEDVQWNSTAIHDAIHNIIKVNNAEPSDGFRIFYKVLIGKEKGPRLGFFISAIDRKIIINRLKEVLN